MQENCSWYSNSLTFDRWDMGYWSIGCQSKYYSVCLAVHNILYFTGAHKIYVIKSIDIIALSYSCTYFILHCKNKITKITNSFVSTVGRNNGNCNVIGRVGCYDCMVTYNVHVLIILPIIIQ